MPLRLPVGLVGLATALALAPAAAAAPVVISEVGSGGGSASPDAPSDEFVELANASGATIDLSGWRLRLRDAECSAVGEDAVVPSGTALAPGQRLLLAGVGWTGPDPDVKLAGSDRLAPDRQAIELVDGSGATVDRAGYEPPLPMSASGPELAVHSCSEGSPASPPPPGGSIERIGGTQDTDDNASDFQAKPERTPQNAASTAPQAPPGGGEPPPAAPPAGPTEQPPPGPQIFSVRFDPETPRVGQTVVVVVRAGGEGLVTTGMGVIPGGGAERVATSACRLRPFGRDFAVGRVSTLRLPLRFTEPGTHEVTVVVRSGGCGSEVRETAQTFLITVEPAAGAAAASPAALLAQRGRRCRGATTVASPRTIRAVDRAVLCLVNQLRRQRRRRGLRASRTLARAAVGHSRDMTARVFFAHEAPGGPGLVARLRRVRYRSSISGENIGFVVGRPTATDIVRAWIASPPHLANMLSRAYRFAGVGTVVGAPVPGVAQPAATWTINFGRNR